MVDPRLRNVLMSDHSMIICFAKGTKVNLVHTFNVSLKKHLEKVSKYPITDGFQVLQLQFYNIKFLQFYNNFTIELEIFCRIDVML